MDKKKLNNNGFSLVELIIVIAIMAVLVGVLAPQFMGYVKKSRIATDIQNAQQIATAIQVKIADIEATNATKLTTADVDTAAEIATILGSTPVSKVNASAAIAAAIDSDDQVTVTYGGITLYPTTPDQRNETAATPEDNAWVTD